MAWYLDLGIIAIFLSGAMALLTRSMLSRVVVFYLIGVMASQSLSSELHPEGLLKVFPSIPLVILFQWFILSLLEKFYIRSKLTSIVLGIAMLFGTACIIENLLGQRYIVMYYGMVIGVTSLVAALEGAFYGGSGVISKYYTGDRRNRIRYSWLFQSLPFGKKD